MNDIINSIFKELNFILDDNNNYVKINRNSVYDPKETYYKCNSDNNEYEFFSINNEETFNNNKDELFKKNNNL